MLRLGVPARLRAFADALLACFRLDSEVSGGIEATFLNSSRDECECRAGKSVAEGDARARASLLLEGDERKER